jgi:biotin operon repressor
MQRRIAQIDQSTGEVLEGVVAFVSSKRRNGFGKEWFAMGMNAAMEFAVRKFSESDYRVLWALLARLDFENHVAIGQTELATLLSMHRVTVNRSIRNLVREGVLLEAGTRPNGYRLNPNFAWRGSGRSHRDALSHLKLVK